jgi:hypothetical protein
MPCEIGMDVVLEALRLWRERRRKKLDVLLKYARMRHVERAMRPYLEAMSRAAQACASARERCPTRSPRHAQPRPDRSIGCRKRCWTRVRRP